MKLALGIDQPTNYQRGGPFYVKFLNHDEVTQAGGAGFGSALFDIDEHLLCIGCEARVEVARDNGTTYHVVYQMCFDERPVGAAGQRLVYLDGTFTPIPGSPYDQGRTLGRWFVQGSAEAMVASVRRYASTVTNWQQDETVKVQFTGDTSDSFFTALQAGGPFPAPVKNQTDAYWRPAAAPPAIAQTPRYLPISLSDAKAQDAASTLTPTVDYYVTGAWNGVANTTIKIHAINTRLEATGVLIGANNGPNGVVSVNLAAGTYTAFASGTSNQLTVEQFRALGDTDNMVWAKAITAMQTQNVRLHSSTRTYTLTQPVFIGGSYCNIDFGGAQFVNNDNTHYVITDAAGQPVPAVNTTEATRTDPGPLAGSAFYFTTESNNTYLANGTFQNFRFALAFYEAHKSPILKSLTFAGGNVGVFCYQGSQNYQLLGCSTATGNGTLFVGSATYFKQGTSIASNGTDQAQGTAVPDYYCDTLTISNTADAYGELNATRQVRFNDWFKASILRPDLPSYSTANPQGYVYDYQSGPLTEATGRVVTVFNRQNRAMFACTFRNIDCRGGLANGLAWLGGTQKNFGLLGVTNIEGWLTADSNGYTASATQALIMAGSFDADGGQVDKQLVNAAIEDRAIVATTGMGYTTAGIENLDFTRSDAAQAKQVAAAVQAGNPTKTVPVAGDNLLDIAAAIADHLRHNSDGSLQPQAGWSATDFMPVTPGLPYATNLIGAYTWFYDAQQNHLGTVASTGGVAPANAAYASGSTTTGALQFAVFVQAAALPNGYQPYWQLISHTRELQALLAAKQPALAGSVLYDMSSDQTLPKANLLKLVQVTAYAAGLKLSLPSLTLADGPQLVAIACSSLNLGSDPADPALYVYPYPNGYRSLRLELNEVVTLEGIAQLVTAGGQTRVETNWFVVGVQRQLVQKFTPPALKAAVTAGTWTSTNELQSDLPLGSLVGMRFTTSTYFYQCTYASSDVRGNTPTSLRQALAASTGGAGTLRREAGAKGASSLTLSSNASGDVLVFVGGQLASLEDGDYTVAGSPPTITLATAPPATARLTVAYLPASGGTSGGTVTPGPAQGSDSVMFTSATAS